VQGIDGPSADMHSFGDVSGRSEGGKRSYPGSSQAGLATPRNPKRKKRQDVDEGLCPEFEWAAADDGPENITGC
jgi:hypothetical protein